MPFAIKIERDADIEALSPTDVRKALAERNELLDKIFVEAGADLDASKVTVIEAPDGRKLAEEIRLRNDELAKLGKRVSELDQIDAARAETERRKRWLDGHDQDPAKFAPRVTPLDSAVPAKSFAQLFVESPAYTAAKARQGNVLVELPVKAEDFLERKTVFETGAGWAPESLRSGRVVLDAQRGIEVTDLFPLLPTNQAAYVYMEETTFTNNAAERNEGAAYAESAFALTEQSVTVRSIGTSLPVTDEQLEDVEGVRAYLDQRLGFAVRQRLDSQLLTGNAVAPNIRGVNNASGIQTQALGADPVPDAIYKAITLVEVTGRAMPSGIIMHPNDWQGIRLLRTADGIYIWGSPSEPGPGTIWGLPVVKTSAQTENTAIVGDFARFAALVNRRGLEIATGFVNDDFTDGRVTIRAGMRVAAVFFRGEAFCKVTGI